MENDKTRLHCHMMLKACAESLHQMLVADIKTPHVSTVLEPMWLAKHQTTSWLRERIEAVMDYARAIG